MRRLVLLVSIAIGLVFAHVFAAAAVRPLVVTGQTPKTALTPIVTANLAPRVELQPAVARLRERPTIVVSGIHARSLEVLLAGATDTSGRPLPWRSLRSVDGAWLGTLPAPALHGVYPIKLRTGAGATPFRSQPLFLRVLAPGTRARPSFDDPAEVVGWWVRTVPHATLVALKAWPRPAFDRRDVGLHRLFVVAYSPPGMPRSATGSACSSRRSATVTADAGGCSRRLSCRETERSCTEFAPFQGKP